MTSNSTHVTYVPRLLQHRPRVCTGMMFAVVFLIAAQHAKVLVEGKVCACLAGLMAAC